jgi:hypothetical protein
MRSRALSCKSQTPASLWYPHLYKMVRTKPDLFLTVPNALDADNYTRSDLITPPCYIVTAPPPILTPSLSRSSSLSTNTTQSDSDCEYEDDEVEVSLRNDAAPWTPDQDEALLNVSLYVKTLILDIFRTFGWTGNSIRTFRSIATAADNRIENLPQRHPQSRLARSALSSFHTTTSHETCSGKVY